MTRVNIPFDLTQEEIESLYNGKIEIGGLVIRDSITKRIIEHKPVANYQCESSKNLENVKGFAFGVGTVIFAGCAAYGIIHCLKKKSRQNNLKRKAIDVLDNYNNVMFNYLEKLQTEELSLKELKAVIDALDKLRELSKVDDIKIELSTKQLNMLYGVIGRYTYQLCYANNYNPKEIGYLDQMKLDSVSNINKLSKIQEFVCVQRELYKEL